MSNLPFPFASSDVEMPIGSALPHRVSASAANMFNPRSRKNFHDQSL